MKFRLLAGQHIQHKDTGKKNENGVAIYEDELFVAGTARNVIDCDIDLTGLNGPGMSPKFERLDLGGRMSHPAGEVFDPTTETIDQFVDRVRAKEAEKKLRATTPQPEKEEKKSPVPGLTEPAPRHEPRTQHSDPKGGKR